MAKFSGKIGFGTENEVTSGVVELTITERTYFGEVVRETLERVGGDTIHGESRTANSFSIVADGYATNNFRDMKYVLWMGAYWSIRQVELQNRPRMLIRIGGVWNGPVATVAPVDPVDPVDEAPSSPESP